MQQEGIYFHNMFAPVVNLSTVRSIVIMDEMTGLESRKIYHVLAFSQARFDGDAYLNLFLQDFM